MPLESQLDIAVDDEVTFTFTITNTGPDPVELEFRSGLTVDFSVYEDDTEVWLWSNGRMATQALHSELINPDESVAYTGIWDNPEPGEYTVRAELQATNTSLESTRVFVVD